MTLSYEGRWITGLSGSERLAELRSTLDLKDIALAFDDGTSQCYAPWMGSVKLRTEQDRIPYPIVKRTINHEPYIVTSASELSALHSYFTREDWVGLQIIGNDPRSTLRVERPDEPWLVETIRMAPMAISTFSTVSITWRQRLCVLCQLIVPMGDLINTVGSRRDVGRGVSSHLFRGSLFLDPPGTEDHRFEAYCINIAHELGHQALIVYQSADPIIDGPLDAPVYSVIRKTDRPAIQSYHATVAAAYMAEFIGDWLQSDSTAARCSYLKTRLAENIDHIENGIKALSGLKYTDVGRQILDEMLDLAAYLRGVHGI